MLLLCLEDGCGHLILLASRAVASLWRPQSHLLYQIMPSDWSPLSAGNKMANAQQYLPKSTALRTDLQHNKVAQPSSKLSEQHKMARLFTGERNEKQKRKKNSPYPQEPSCISLSSRYSCNLSHSYLIPQEFPARLMCYWFQVSCYWNGGGMGRGGEAGLQGVRARDWNKRGGRGRKWSAMANAWTFIRSIIPFIRHMLPV